MSSSEKEPASCRQVHFKIRDTVNLLLTSISAFSHRDTKQWHHLCFCTGGGVFGLRSFICGGAAAAICNNRCYQCFFWSELQLEAETCCRRSVSAAAAPFHWEVIGLFVRLNSWDVCGDEFICSCRTLYRVRRWAVEKWDGGPNEGVCVLLSRMRRLFFAWSFQMVRYVNVCRVPEGERASFEMINYSVKNLNFGWWFVRRLSSFTVCICMNTTEPKQQLH